MIALKIWARLPLSQRWRWVVAWMLRQKFRVGVAAFIMDEEGRLLLCEHTYRGEYAWGLPGGDLKKGEDVETGTRREVLEETGFEVEVIRPLLLHNSKQFPHLSLLFVCRIITGNFQPNLEVKGIQFFKADSLPAFILPTERELIAEAYEKLGNDD